MRRNPLIRVLSLALPFWRGMALAALLGTLTVASSVSLMAASAWLISRAALQPSISELSVAVVSVRFFGIARGIFRYFERLVSHEATFRLLARMRVAFYRSIEPSAAARLTSASSGDLLSRVINDIESLQNLYLRAVAPPVVAAAVALLLTVFLNLFDPLIALTALGFMLTAGIGVPLLAWWANENAGNQRVASVAALNAALIDNVQGMAETLAFGRTSAQLEAVQRLSQQVMDAERRISRIDALQLAISSLLASGAAVIVLVVAIPRVEGIYLATVSLATSAVFEAFLPLAQAAVNLGGTTNAARRLFEIADMPPVVVDPVLPAQCPAHPALEIRGLTFSYAPRSRPVLQDVSLRLEYGQRVAILGESGGGKSTLVNLLVRFWDYDSGHITLGGRELRDYTQFDIRSVFGVMTQRTYLFNTTIRENIRIARGEASDDDIETAARQAQIHDFIASLPDGYNTLVGENGSQLSGGERQRIALARVLLRNVPILILDEATANLDPATEYAIMETVLQGTTGRSLLLFTHRHTLLNRMDAIYVIQQNRLLPYRL